MTQHIRSLKNYQKEGVPEALCLTHVHVKSPQDVHSGTGKNYSENQMTRNPGKQSNNTSHTPSQMLIIHTASVSMHSMNQTQQQSGRYLLCPNIHDNYCRRPELGRTLALHEAKKANTHRHTHNNKNTNDFINKNSQSDISSPNGVESK